MSATVDRYKDLIQYELDDAKGSLSPEQRICVCVRGRVSGEVLVLYQRHGDDPHLAEVAKWFASLSADDHARLQGNYGAISLNKAALSVQFGCCAFITPHAILSICINKSPGAQETERCLDRLERPPFA
ncbi:hypothetical protein GNI_123990 [Gregarina niphandrodes]|uniref:Uncharacterized protein n=1 Tax=Gregarina niphandrodes TaxID=110365 RepID=A0A023B2A7_GRENI|nr:hypothetical protein GNI_123990 [Gregarina niphandrodes]EZG51586.1 hypothetical protein GNI_123990 [Gregarina niphandrodes]|eukprot:XP_011131946.1 hypothetical protein GNI_123990 [Gregarina niphandrodes]